MIELNFRKYLSDILYKSYEYRLNNYNSTYINSKKFHFHLKKCQNFYNKEVQPDEINKHIHEFNSRGFTFFDSKISNSLINSVDNYINSKNFDKNVNLLDEFPILIELFDKEIGSIIEGIYSSYFYIFYGLLTKKIGENDIPKGSELWHSDGGPGTCINIMFVTSELTKESGALELIEFDTSKKLLLKMNNEINDKYFSKLPRIERRNIKVKWLQNEIGKLDISKIYQPTGNPGKVIIFRNNTIHRGGFCQKGYFRNAFIFHVYPSDKKIDWDDLKKVGLLKKSPIPKL